jgi:murein L,D-transpeptidase YafK
MKRTLLLLLIAVVTFGVLFTWYFYPYQKMPADIVIDKIMVDKSAHQMKVYSNNVLIKTYTIAIGSNNAGAKEYKGDKRTPEGTYFIFDKKPNSGWHKNLGISYPNKVDIAKAIENGKHTGGDIKIHGLKNDGFPFGKFHRFRDWTKGCIAITNEEIDDLYEHTPVGTPIIITP